MFVPTLALDTKQNLCCTAEVHGLFPQTFHMRRQRETIGSATDDCDVKGGFADVLLHRIKSFKPRIKRATTSRNTLHGGDGAQLKVRQHCRIHEKFFMARILLANTFRERMYNKDGFAL